MGRRKTVAHEVGGVRNKTAVIDVDEKSIGTELSVEKSVEVEEHMAPVGDFEIQFTGKKKSKSKVKKSGNSFGDETFDVTKDEEDEVSDEEDVSVVFSGKKNPSKLKKDRSLFIGSAFDAIGDDNDDVVVDNSEPKQQSEDEGDEPVISFTGKKKKSSKSDKKTSCITSKEADVPEISKNKKKKKGGRTAQEEVDIDKILAELGEAPATSAAIEPSQEKVQPQTEPATVADEEVTEPAAATKKKKKKKEKEKGKKSATPVVDEKTVESTGKVPNKKVPKHVREIQERLARLKEAEEKKIREEEEKLRKEEEERLRQEEVEERKRLKKEKDKEKMLKKKQEGKLLTAKQKAEAQRLELMRNQILGKGGALLLRPGETSGKRPIYTTKKSKPHQQANGKATNSHQEDNVSELGFDKADEADMENVDEKAEAPAVEEENGNKEDSESDYDWDDADPKLPGINAFADEEEGTVPAPAVKKENQQPVANKGEQQAVIGKNEKEGEKTLRSPICCIMGHVDSGKTKLLDCIRSTTVQEGEAGGITQQISASYIPVEHIRERTKELKADAKLNVPGLLVIDTPGHEAFNNLRSRGSGLCDIAILVVDIMHGLKPQTIESINLLRMRKTEFIVALNKVDRLYGWKTCRNTPIGKAMKQQSKDVQREFDHRVTQIITQFKEQGLNTELYNKNKERGETYSIVPTSAISGEGIPELLLLLIQWAQKTMVKKLTYNSEVQCTVLEVKVIQGCGTTVDVVLVNGVLHEGDEIIGPIHTTIRSLTPHLMKELGGGAYKEIKAAQVIKITAQNLEHAVAGTALYVVKPDDDVEEIKELVMDDMRNVMSRIDKSGEGVYVHASTLGSLEALLKLLKTPPVSIPVCGIGIGPVHKKDVMKASVMREKKKEFATILAFDVKVAAEAQEFADNLGVKIFIADTIYHFLDQFKAYVDNLKEATQQKAAEDAVFPCVLEIMPNCVFNKNDPIILGVDVKEGILKIGTPICIPQKNFIDIGRVSSIKKNDRPVDHADKGQKVAIKITGSNAEEQQKRFGRHFDMEDELVSHISRRSIDALKAHYREELSIEEWKLVKQLKERVFKIQ
ncbi:hypothetical protein M8C21_013622 [Ambrosia artemisiifolia]|uniref:Eukaryotic translation initiation factor 5B n=1 Tax=Ambrosia artemisiifolia TaxID=4212 RepID=A0AAD5BLP8_AMBAR|nr:hypothetical protein M8C21_013622 [Ambrosia artemisiifolia]